MLNASHLTSGMSTSFLHYRVTVSPFLLFSFEESHRIQPASFFLGICSPIFSCETSKRYERGIPCGSSWLAWGGPLLL